MDIAAGHGIAISTFWHALHQTLHAIDECKELEMQFPSTQDELSEAGREGERLRRLLTDRGREGGREREREEGREGGKKGGREAKAAAQRRRWLRLEGGC